MVEPNKTTVRLVLDSHSVDNLRGGQKYRLTLPRPPRMETICLEIVSDGRPRRGADYVLHVDGTPHTGTTDGQGLLQCRLPATSRAGRLVFEAVDGWPAAEYELVFQQLAPVGEVLGMQQRLRNLGFYDGPMDGAAASVAAALASFQLSVGELAKSEALGEPSPRTGEALVQIHGC